VKGRIFFGAGTPPPATQRSFASSTAASVVASHAVGVSSAHPFHEAGVEEEQRKGGKEDNPLHES
jgi:hypothetical protein